MCLRHLSFFSALFTIFLQSRNHCDSKFNDRQGISWDELVFEKKNESRRPGKNYDDGESNPQSKDQHLSVS